MKHTGLYRPLPAASAAREVLVYGAYGHTGCFIVRELVERGFAPVLAGRDARRLEEVAHEFGGLPTRAITLDAGDALTEAIHGTVAVINAAGPFAVTATPVFEAALRAGRPYLDIAAEPDIVEATIRAHATAAAAAGIPLVTAAAFFGGLGDLLATAVMREWETADAITIAYALSSWKPTAGTRRTIELAEHRREGGRLVFDGERLQLRSGSAAMGEWTFPPPFGVQPVVTEFTTGDSVTIARHLRVGRIHEVMTTRPLQDLDDPDQAAPGAVDARGRSAQRFMIEVRARRGDEQRGGVVEGQDIYAVSAPLVVEALHRILDDRRPGVATLGQLGDARSFLEALAPHGLMLSLD